MEAELARIHEPVARFQLGQVAVCALY
jgi:hypothetical protein